jgi:hypothetical protein
VYGRSNPFMTRDPYNISECIIGVNKKDGLETLTSVSIELEGCVSVISSVNFHKFFDDRSAQNNLNSQIFTKTPLPICVRYKSDKCIVVERPPFKVSPRISYFRSSASQRDRSQKERDIWIPWTVMVITASSSFDNPRDRTNVIPYLFFRDAPLTSFDDLLALPYTPNIYSNGRICLGQSEHLLTKSILEKDFSYSDIAELYAFIANEYFMGGWNLDLTIPGTFFGESRVVPKSFLSRAKELAEKFSNKYMLTVLKSGQNISYYEKVPIKFYMNYLSCLDLDEVLEHTRKMTENHSHEFNPYSRNQGRPDSGPFSLADVLSDIDESFRVLYKDKYKSRIHKSDTYDFTENVENKELVRYCVSNSSNKTPLHRLKIIIKFDISDFLDFASERILTKYLSKSVHDVESGLLSLFEADRKDFYKKNIVNNILKHGYAFNIIARDYITEIQRGSNREDFAKAIDNVMRSLGNFYRTEEGLQKVKNVVNIDLAELGIVISKEVSEKDVLV